MTMSLHLLRIFHAVAEQHSFSRAAGVLFISQSAVSKGVRELEHQLDLALIERNAGGVRGLRLTESGQALFEHARGIFALEQVALEDLRARAELRRGRLAVGASTTIAGYRLPAYVAAFRRRHPEVQLEVRVGNTRAMSQALIDCEIDIALVEGEVTDARIMAKHWQDDGLTVIAATGAAIARSRRADKAALARQTWLLREPGSGTRAVTERLMQARGLAPAQTLVIGSNEGIARAVAAGAGIAMLPTQVVRELMLLERVQAVRCPDARALVRPLYLLQLRERPPSPSLRAFCEVLAQPPEA